MESMEPTLLFNNGQRLPHPHQIVCTIHALNERPGGLGSERAATGANVFDAGHRTRPLHGDIYRGVDDPVHRIHLLCLDPITHRIPGLHTSLSIRSAR